MSDFHTLPYDEQVTRLQATAEQALLHAGMPCTAIELVSYENNAVFRTSHEHDPDCAVRVYRPGAKTRAEIESEQVWLTLLDVAGGLRVPTPNRPLYAGTLDGVEGEVYVGMWYWLDGESLPAAEHTPGLVQRIGAYMATLHQITVQVQPPFAKPGDAVLAQRPQLDYEGLFGERSPYASEQESDLINPAQQTVLDAVAGQVRHVMTALDTDNHTTGLIHGDLIYKNTLIGPDGTVAALDFDDCGFGYFLYDMACPLLFYKPLPAYADLKAALWDGYTAVRSLPGHYRGMLEVLVAGRYVASCRWVAAHADHPAIRGRADEIIAGRVDELRGFLDSGQLR
ncbi:MAG: phosphotransferase [Chloroflexota bacterium]